MPRRSPPSARTARRSRPDEVLAIMRYDAGKRLDAGAFAALEAWLPSRLPRQVTAVV